MARRDWTPANAYVLVLGLGLADWADPEDPNWRRHVAVAQFFKDAGVPPRQVLLWEDKEGEPERMRKKLADFLANTTEDAIFFFYYAGHGDIDYQYEDGFYFVHPTSDDGFYGVELFDLIEEQFWGTQAVILADCCFSGSLVELAAAREGNVSYGVLTSATSDVLSTGNWTFTDCLLEGLRGKAALDRDRDGTVSFKELCTYVLRRMKQDEDQPAAYGEGGEFDPSFRLAVVKKAAER